MNHIIKKLLISTVLTANIFGISYGEDFATVLFSSHQRLYFCGAYRSGAICHFQPYSASLTLSKPTIKKQNTELSISVYTNASTLASFPLANQHLWIGSHVTYPELVNGKDELGHQFQLTMTKAYGCWHTKQCYNVQIQQVN